MHSLSLETITTLLGLLATITALTVLCWQKNALGAARWLWLSIIIGEWGIITSGAVQWILVGLSICCAIIYANVRPKSDDFNSNPIGRPALISYSLCIAIIAIPLLFRISNNFDAPLVWESTVALNFLTELREFDPLRAFTTRLLWHEGLMSEGDTSLTYGFPTAILLNNFSSLTSLRLVSALCFILTAILLSACCITLANSTLSLVALLVFGLNELALIFGRYGSSTSATLCALMLALYLCAMTVRNPSLLRSLVACLALFLATLGYAPARLVTLLLLAATVIGVWLSSQAGWRKKGAITAAMCSATIIVCLLQFRAGTLNNFASARHEQFFKMFDSEFWPNEVMPLWREFKLEQRQPNARDYLKFAYELISQTTAHQLLEIALPVNTASDLSRDFSNDPLHHELYSPFLLPFLFIGIASGGFYLSRWLNTTLIGFSALALLPILLTNRVDSYRTCMALIPCSIWISVGVTECIRMWRRTHLSHVSLVTIATLCLTLTVSSRLKSLSEYSIALTTTDRIVESLTPRFLEDSIMAIEAQNFRSAAQTGLIVLGRKQRGLSVPSKILTDTQYNELLLYPFHNKDRQNDLIKPLVAALSQGHTIILGPTGDMAPIINNLTNEIGNAYRLPIATEIDAVMILPKNEPRSE